MPPSQVPNGIAQSPAEGRTTMKCVCCGNRINPKRDRHQYIRDTANRKRLACAKCADNGKFDKWLEKQAERKVNDG